MLMTPTRILTNRFLLLMTVHNLNYCLEFGVHDSRELGTLEGIIDS